MKIDKINSKHLIADEGKVLRRMSDSWIAGTEIYLGYTYYLGGEKLSEPLLELPEHYEEVIELEDLADDAFDVEVEVITESATSLMSVPDPVPKETEVMQVKLTDLLVRALNEIDTLKKEIEELKK